MNFEKKFTYSYYLKSFSIFSKTFEKTEIAENDQEVKYDLLFYIVSDLISCLNFVWKEFKPIKYFLEAG